MSPMKVTSIYKTYKIIIKAVNCIIKEKWKIKTSVTTYLLQFYFHMNVSYWFCCKRHLLSLLSLFGFFLFHFFLVLFILLHSYFFPLLSFLVLYHTFTSCQPFPLIVFPLLFSLIYSLFSFVFTNIFFFFIPSAHSSYPLLLFLLNFLLFPFLFLIIRFARSSSSSLTNASFSLQQFPPQQNANTNLDRKEWLVKWYYMKYFYLYSRWGRRLFTDY